MDAIVTQMIILFILVIIGYYLSKKKMMDADFDRKLSGLVINVTCPSLILSSVMGDTLPDRKLILPLLIVGFVTYVLLIGAAFLLPRYLPVKSSDRGIYSFMLAFGNVGFIGYPIVASIFGSSAVFYASILNFPSTLLIFVFGTLFISGGQGKMRFDWRTLYCPAMIASYLSILIAGFRATCQYLLWFYLVTRLIRNDRDCMTLYLTLVARSFVLSLHGIYQYITKAPMPASWVAQAETAVRTRVYSIFGSPNIMGDFMVMVAPMCAGLAYCVKDTKWKIAAWIGTILMCIACLFTMSRASWVAMAIAVVIIDMLVARRLQKLHAL